MPLTNTCSGGTVRDMTTTDSPAPLVATPQDIYRLFQTASNVSLPALERLKASDELRGRLKTFEGQLVGHARDAGRTWEEIAEVLEVSKQAAHARFGGS
jgi:hypothetical protein